MKRREEIEKLEKSELIEIIIVMSEQIKELAERVAELEGQIKMNSRNSSKRPSSDWNPVKIPREQSGKSQGGQPGHNGNFLKIETEADKTIEIKPEICQKCGGLLPETTDSPVETRHKIDVEIRRILTKYEQYEVICPCCGKENRGEFPREVKNHVSYGEGVQTIGVLLTSHANVSYGKTSEIMNEVFGVPISCGTLVNHVNEFASKCEPVLKEIKEQVKQGGIAHFDETSVRVRGKNYWVHTAGNRKATYNTVHPKRGRKGTDDNGVLKDFKGVAVHDCLVQYFGYDNALHAVCNAHLLRELQGVIENKGYIWAGDMQKHLRNMKKAVDDCIAEGRTALLDELLESFTREYDRILALGETETPRDTSQKKQSKSRNLLERFINYRTEITRFSNDFAVPFTNNQAERDIRNTKIKMKVSGGFRSDDGAKNFAKISSVISTAAKHGLSAFKTVSQIFINSANITLTSNP